ncbi:TROVE domain-containing protein [Micromonospora sp. FIMYZ51]|uniref:TROVE domain-containing protein n=1 Tax=Micromonospora sp. FIMYZ51 TaxID=3051832 RepID=UPI00311D30F6
MAKFNTATARPSGTSPIVGENTPTGLTHEGAPGFARDARSELFLLAVANMVGEKTFYESASTRDDRYEQLVRHLAVTDPQWTGAFLRWLRADGNMRSASLVGALEAAKAMVAAGIPGSRAIVAEVLQRADEPGEALAYWTGRYGRAIPKPVKRGIADAVLRLYTERSLLKYDTASKGFRFGDVIDLVHPVADAPWRGDLFKFALDRRHGRDDDIPESLATICHNDLVRATAADDPVVLLNADRLNLAGMTWEDALSLAGSKVDKARLWEALIPSMGYMACLAEGTPVWLPDGTTAPIEEVVARRLPVLSYDKSWDTRPVKYGPGQGPRDMSVGALVPAAPSAWLDMGVRPVATIRFVSGRVIEATYDHRWVRQRKSGRQAWEWTTTADLRVGDRIPAPLTADYFGDEGDAWDGYFVGAMLGDGGMTALSPEFHGDPDDGAVAFMREYATKHNCGIREDQRGKIVRMRFPFKQWQRNPLTDVLRRYEVWGKRVEVKALPQRPFSREFWIGALSGLIDTDGCVRERHNAKGTFHASVEYATVSRRLADQVSDTLLRLGVTNVVRERPARGIGNFPLFVVEVSRATAVVRLAGLLDLRIGYKSTALIRAAERLAHVSPAQSEMHGYDEAVALDRIAAIEDGGERATYCVTVEPSNLFIANGIVTGNCLRNLRNFDQAGVSDEVAAQVAARLADPQQVAKSRQFPFRFLAAYRNAPSLRWGYALDKALTASLSNVPELSGRTLVLVDRSGSMFGRMSEKSELTSADAAAVFGSSVALRNVGRVDLVEFGNGSNVIDVKPGDSLLRTVDRFTNLGGTQTLAAVQRHYAGHDRVLIVTDEQAWSGYGDPGSAIPATVPLYTWNLLGYRHGHGTSGSRHRHTFGGLTDAAFRMVPLIEAGQSAKWPWNE